MRISTFKTDKEIKALKPQDKNYTATDSIIKGLQLIVRTDGAKQWALRYSSPIIKDKNGKPQRRQIGGIGTYPDISLENARIKANSYKDIIRQGIDPLELKQEIKEQVIIDDKSQFHRVFYQWINEVLENKNTKSTTIKKISNFERNIFPYFCTYDKNHNIISSKPISEIHHSEILNAIKNIFHIAETAKRTLADCNRLWLFAISNGYCEFNIIANISRDVMPKVAEKHMPKITDEKILGKLLCDIDNYKGSPIVRNALRLYPYVMLRATNLTTLKWEYIDFDKKLLTIPRSEMKVKNQNLNDFKLPLVDSAINILKDVKQITGWSEWVFHGVKNIHKPLDKETCNKSLRSLGYDSVTKNNKQTQHSFRGTFRSIVDTNLHLHKMPFELREAILDHHEKNIAVRAYTHKADYTEQARELLIWWEQFLDKIKHQTTSKV